MTITSSSAGSAIITLTAGISSPIVTGSGGGATTGLQGPPGPAGEKGDPGQSIVGPMGPAGPPADTTPFTTALAQKANQSDLDAASISMAAGLINLQAAFVERFAYK